MCTLYSTGGNTLSHHGCPLLQKRQVVPLSKGSKFVKDLDKSLNRQHVGANAKLTVLHDITDDTELVKVTAYCFCAK